jgi:allantoicase
MNEESLDRVPGGRVVACSDEGFAPAENLLATRAPEFRFGVFIPGKGQEFDSWETRRHNPAAPDWAILELGASGPIATVDIDTHWHDGNHAEQGAVFALRGAPGESPTRDDPRWVVLLPPRALDGHAHNVFRTPAGEAGAWTHVMLENHPDGGIARLRCHAGHAPRSVDPGEQTERRVRHEAPIPRGGDSVRHGPSAAEIEARWRGVAPGAVVDLASEALGGLVVATSNNRYGHSQQLLAEAPPTSMGDGWETSRSRGPGHHDHVVVALARPGVIEQIEVDFRYFVLNNPVSLRLLGASVAAGSLPGDEAWVEIVARTPVKALAGSSLRLDTPALRARGPFSHLRLETFPDGGANRLRVLGRPA